MEMKKILSNKAKCLICGEVLESCSEHDFKMCSCGNLAVDGGYEYIRRVCRDETLCEELSEIEEYICIK